MMKFLKERLVRFLRAGEKYTKTDNVYLFKGGLWISLGQFFSSGSSLILAIAFANLLPKETYGTYKYVISVISILGITTLSGMGSALTQAIARGFEGSFIPVLKTKIRWGLLGALGGLGIAAYYFFNGNTQLAFLFLLASGFVPFIDSLNEFDSLLNGKKLFAKSTQYNSAIKIVGVTALIITIFLTKNIFAVVGVYFLSYTLLRFFFLRQTLKHYPPNSQIDPQTLSYGKHSSLASSFATLANYLDQLLLFHILGPINLAIYTFAIAPIEQSKVLFKSLPALALPKLAQRTIPEINSLLYRRLLVLLGIAFLGVGLYYFIAPWVYQWLFPNYSESIRYSQIFSLTLLVTVPMNMLSPALNAKLTTIPKKFIYLWNLPDLILISSLLILTAQFGILGVIISKILSRTTVLIVSLFIWKRIQPT